MSRAAARRLAALVLGVGLPVLAPAAGAASMYTNPVIAANLADPTVIRHDGRYYLYATESPTVGYHAWISTDLVHWVRGPMAFRTDIKNAWAPDVYRHPEDGRFYLYYTASQQIGVAVADRPEGPFQDRGILHRGTIDAHLFRDGDGRLYLYYVHMSPWRILAQPMKNPLTPGGEPVKVLEPTEPWETVRGRVTEGPWVLKRGATYYLIYSGTGADSADYGVGYATAASPLGPFRKNPGNPILHRSEGVFGPGHGMPVEDGAGGWWYVYHQKARPEQGWSRFVCVDRLVFDAAGRLSGEATHGVARLAPVPLGARR